MEIVDSVVRKYGVPVRAPSSRVDRVPDDWRGSVLPSDYASLMDAYGGCITLRSWILILDPWIIFGSLDEMRDDLEQVNFGDVILVEPNGEEVLADPSPQAREIHISNLIKWGETDTGVPFYWHTVGDADNWPILVRMSGFWGEYRMGAVEFIFQILSGELDCEYLTARHWEDDSIAIQAID